MAPSLDWSAARAAAHAAGRAARPDPVEVALDRADGLTLAAGLVTLTDLPAFATSSVDGYATRGAGPWRVVGRVLAGTVSAPLDEGDAAEIATGAMVPAGTDQIIRTEDATVGDGRVTGKPRPVPEWREPGDEAGKGEELIPAGSPVTPAVIGLAASCGYATLPVQPATRVAVVIFGDELLTAGPPGQGRVRDALGPQLPAWLRRLGAEPVGGFDPRGPVEDTLDAHVSAIRDALAAADLVCTTGGTMHGPVDHLHPALAALDANYVADTVAVRPGYPMLLARVDVPGNERPRFVAGLPGNPQSAIVALVSLVEPLLRGLAGRGAPPLRRVSLGGPIAGRGEHTHLALAQVDEDGCALPVEHAASSMLRGLARADGFAVIEPGSAGNPGDVVPFVPLPLTYGGRP
jgi:molybdopterin molybdotransferase